MGIGKPVMYDSPEEIPSFTNEALILLNLLFSFIPTTLYPETLIQLTIVSPPLMS